MEQIRKKFNLPVITGPVFDLAPDRYQLRKGTLEDAPPCPFGHRFKWIGYDSEKEKYVRVTKSVFKRLINGLDEDFVQEHERDFAELTDMDDED